MHYFKGTDTLVIGKGKGKEKSKQDQHLDKETYLGINKWVTVKNILPNRGCGANRQIVNNHHTNMHIKYWVHRMLRIANTAEQHFKIFVTPAAASKADLFTMTLCLMAERSNIKWKIHLLVEVKNKKKERKKERKA